MKKKFMQSSVVLAIIAIGITIGSVFITQYIVGTIAFIIYGTSKYSETPTIFFVLAYSLATLMLMLGYYLFVVWIERREVTELAKLGAAKEVGLGIAIGSGIIAVVVAILWMLGYYKVVGMDTAEVLVRPLFISILAGVAGEVIFRGILFRFVEKGWGSRFALILSAILFGFLHAANPNATFVGGLAIAVGAGLLLGGAYMWTRRLWLVMGIHFAWNFTLGSIFGLPVSGNESVGLLQPDVTGPVLLTGGNFGPEASLITLAVGLAVGIVIIKKAHEDGQFVDSKMFR